MASTEQIGHESWEMGIVKNILRIMRDRENMLSLSEGELAKRRAEFAHINNVIAASLPEVLEQVKKDMLDELLEYGKKVRGEALEDAAKLCEEEAHGLLFGHDLAVRIRKLLEDSEE